MTTPEERLNNTATGSNEDQIKDSFNLTQLSNQNNKANNAFDNSEYTQYLFEKPIEGPQ